MSPSSEEVVEVIKELNSRNWIITHQKMWIRREWKCNNTLEAFLFIAIQYEYRELANWSTITWTMSHFPNLLSNTGEREHAWKLNLKATCGYLFSNKYGLKNSRGQGRPFWELKFTHINVYTYYHNFCSISQEAERWKALVIKIT